MSRPTIQPTVSAPGSNRRARRHPEKNDPSPRRWASLKDAGDYLGVTDRTIRAMISSGKIGGYRTNARLVRVDLNEIDAAMTPFGGGAA